MKKHLTLLTIFLLCATSLLAQAPQTFSYQAVVRTANNTLVSNTMVGVRVSIVQGSETGNVVYSETHTVISNANGLVTLSIGDGSVLHGVFGNIDWTNGPYFLKTDIDPNGGNSYMVSTTQRLQSVPYALYAGTSANGFSGDYNDLTNTPTIPVVPENVSAFTNDAGYLTTYTETDPQFNAWDKDYNDLSNKPILATVATTGNYADLSNLPTIPTVPTNVSAFSNDANYVTDAQLNALLAVMNNTIDSLRQVMAACGCGGGTGDFQCGVNTISDYDGNIYNTVRIGNQCWMKENLRTTNYADGTPILPGSTYSATTAYYYAPNNDSSNVAAYGYLYNWPALMHEATSSDANPSGVQGICPTGWHVPSNAEWTQLTDYVSSQSQYWCEGNNTYIAKALASSTGWESSTNTCDVGNSPDNNNATGFGALPAGIYNSTGFSNFGHSTYFWSTTELTSTSPYYRNIISNYSMVYINGIGKLHGCSVRCLRD